MYNKWAASEHPSGGKNNMNEIMEISPSGGAGSTNGTLVDVINNVAFEFNGSEEVKLIKADDESWIKYEKVSIDETTATALRID